MFGHDIIVVGASAGGVEALSQLIPLLPPDLPAAVFIVLHIPSQGTSVLPNILNRAIAKRQKNSTLKAVHPQDGEKIVRGRIYIAPPDRHLLVKDGYIRLARGPRENCNRPAVDPLFRTAAKVYGRRVVGVVLSGTLDDGTAGLMAVKQRGGVAIVQKPESALYSGMPCNAIENVEVDHILPLAEIATMLTKLAYQPVEENGEDTVSRDLEMECDTAELELGAMQNSERPGTPSPFGCPDCGGVLWELEQGKLIHFRCRTGHAYSTHSLLAAQTHVQEEAMWNALRALEEKAALTQRMAKRANERNQHYSAQRFEEQATVAHERAAILRELLLKGDGNGHKAQSKGSEGADGDGDLRTLQSKIELLLPTRPFHLIAICASAGGLNALSQVLYALPGDFPAAIVIVQHVSPQHSSTIADILSRRTQLQVKFADVKDVLRPGTVYIAPPDQHLLVNSDNTLCLSRSELVHYVRPSADLLFESVAASFKQRAIAVILTGTGSDGAIGVRAIKQMGGKVIAQDRTTAEFFAMPEAAINTGDVDLVVPLNEIATKLINLVTIQEENLNQL
ncbi:MAG TPA: chemotaxis protein CheB [Cyanobacteria bacterium UBA11049]|nr:chemotaxis protein CheB [Cyanobacteria bacterium UBA11049]